MKPYKIPVRCLLCPTLGSLAMQSFWWGAQPDLSEVPPPHEIAELGLATRATHYFWRGYKRSLSSFPLAGVALLDPPNLAVGLDQNFLCLPTRPRGLCKVGASG